MGIDDGPLPGAAGLERPVGGNHDHIVCRVFGRTEDLDCVIGAQPCLIPAEDHGFAVDEAEAVFGGICTASSAAVGSLDGAQPDELARAPRYEEVNQ